MFFFFFASKPFNLEPYSKNGRQTKAFCSLLTIELGIHIRNQPRLHYRLSLSVTGDEGNRPPALPRLGSLTLEASAFALDSPKKRAHLPLQFFRFTVSLSKLKKKQKVAVKPGCIPGAFPLLGPGGSDLGQPHLYPPAPRPRLFSQAIAAGTKSLG